MRASVADRAGNVAEAFIDLPEGTGNPPDLASPPQGFDDPPPLARNSEAGTLGDHGRAGFHSRFGRTALVARISSRCARKVAADAPHAPSQGWDVQRKPLEPNWDQGGADQRTDDLFAAAGGSGFGAGGASPRDRVRGTRRDKRPVRRAQFGRDASGRESRNSSCSMPSRTLAPPVRRRSSSGSRTTAAEPGFAAAATRIASLRSRSTSVARGRSGYAWSPARPRDWATSPPRRETHRKPGSKSTRQLQSFRSETPQIGTGVNAGKVAIAWKATDLHLAPRSVTLSWRPDQPGAQWQTIADGLDNAGQFIWNVPPAVSEKFHLRVEASRLGGSPRRGRHDRVGPDHRRPQPPPQPHHRPGPERPFERDRRRREAGALTIEAKLHQALNRQHQLAVPNSSLMASRSAISSAADASSLFFASASIGTPGTIDQSHAPFETRGKL